MGMEAKIVSIAASILLTFLGAPLIESDVAWGEEATTIQKNGSPEATNQAQDATVTATESPEGNAVTEPSTDGAEPTVDAANSPIPPATSSTSPVAQVVVGGKTTNYATLQEAITAAPAGATIALLTDIDIPSTTVNGTNLSLAIDKALTLDGQNHVLTVHGRGIYLTGGGDEAHSANFAVKNISITNPDDYGRTVSARNGYKTLQFEAAQLSATGAGNTQVFTLGGNTPQTTTVTFDGCAITASTAGYGIITFNPINLTLADTDVSGYAALYMKGPDSSVGSSNSTVTIENGSFLTSKGIAGPTDRFGTIVLQQCENIDIKVTNSTVEAQSNNAAGGEAAPQSVVMYSINPVDDPAARSSNNSVTFGEGAKVNALGTNSSLTTVNGNENHLNATDGTYILKGAVYDVPDQSASASPTKISVTGGHWNKDMSAYVPEGYKASNTGDDADAPYAVTPETTEPSDPTHHAGDGDNPDSPDKPDGQETEPSGEATDDGTESGDANDDESKEAAGETDNESGNASASSGTTVHGGGSNTSSYRASANSSSSFPKTADNNLPAALVTATASLAVASAAAFAGRKMRQEE